MEIVTVLVAGAAVGILYKKFIIDPEKAIENHLEQKKNEPKKDDETEKKSEAFFGIDKVKKDPESFLVDIDRLAEKLERGEKVKVNAAEALYMMRNSRYHNLIIGEDGTINFKKIANNTDESEETIKGDIFEERLARKSNEDDEVHNGKEAVETEVKKSKNDDEVKSQSFTKGQGCLLLEEDAEDLDFEELDEEICCDDRQEVPRYEIVYVDYKSFMVECKKPEFVDLVLENVFSEKGCGSVYVDQYSKKIIVEKNYFAKAIRSLMLPEHQKQFDRDFISKVFFNIYDSNRMDELFSSMQKCEKIFDSHGKGGSRFLFNLLIEFVEINQLFLSAWFVRIPFGSNEISDRFVNSGWRIQEIKVIEDDKRRIDGMARRIENLKRIF